MSDFSHSLALMARLTAANLRRRRREAAGLAAFAAVAVFALQLGLVLLIDCPRLFDRLALDQSAPDFAVVESEAAWSERQLDGLKANPAVRQCETERVIFARAAPVYNGTPTPTTVMLSDFDRPRRLDRPAQVDGAEALTDDAIYLPYAFKVGGGYDVGDRFTVELPGYDLDLEVAGFINEVFYGSLLRDWHRFYVTTAVWRDIAEQIPARVGVLLSVSLDDPAAADQMYLDYMTEEVYSDPQLTTGGFGAELTADGNTLQETRTGRMAVTTMTAGLLVLSAGLTLVVCLIVIRFAVVTAIEESMANLSVLKALGYTSRHLAGALLGQFTVPAVLAAAVGVAAAQAVLPPLAGALAAQSWLAWRPGFVVPAAGLAAAVVVAGVALTTLWTAQRVRRLTPLSGLRVGLRAAVYKRNRWALAKTRGPLGWLLALKQARQSAGQMATVGAVVTAIGFLVVFTVAAYDSLGRDRFATARMLVGELSDITAWAYPGRLEEAVTAIRQQPEVERAFPYDSQMSVLIDNAVTQVIVTDDYADLTSSPIYEGEAPRLPGQVAVSGRLAEVLGKTVGDAIELSTSGRMARYTITGLAQMFTDSGLLAAVTAEGLRRIDPAYEGTVIYVHLRDQTAGDAVLDQLEAAHGDVIFGGLNAHAMAEAKVNPVLGLLSGFTKILVAVAAALVALVLRLVMTTMLRRRRLSFGIQKAVGFSAPQLITQVTLVYLPLTAAAFLVGAVAADLAYEPIMAVLLRPVGLRRVLAGPPLGTALLIAAGFAVFAAVMAVWASWQVRRVGPRTLMSE